MSAPVALPAPRVFRLPRVRVKFKRPRWPKGDRLWLALAATNSALFALRIVLALLGRPSVFWALWDAALAAWCWWAWWRSRDDDDGPSAHA